MCPFLFLRRGHKKEVQIYRLNKQNDNICILFIIINSYKHKKLRSAFKAERSILKKRAAADNALKACQTPTLHLF